MKIEVESGKYLEYGDRYYIEFKYGGVKNTKPKYLKCLNLEDLLR